MKFYETDIWGFTHALRGMRNPTGTWRDSDTQWLSDGTLYIGPNDLQFAKSCIDSGAIKSRFLKQIFVSVDITAPLYWWKEFDHYTDYAITIGCDCPDESIMTSGFLLEKRTVVTNYRDIRNIVRQAQSSSLKEWSTEFTRWAMSLPYAVPFIFDKDPIKKEQIDGHT